MARGLLGREASAIGNREIKGGRLEQCGQTKAVHSEDRLVGGGEAGGVLLIGVDSGAEQSVNQLVMSEGAGQVQGVITVGRKRLGVGAVAQRMRDAIKAVLGAAAKE